MKTPNIYLKSGGVNETNKIGDYIIWGTCVEVTLKIKKEIK